MAVKASNNVLINVGAGTTRRKSIMKGVECFAAFSGIRAINKPAGKSV